VARMWKGLQEGLEPLSKGEEDRLRRVFDRIDKNADGIEMPVSVVSEILHVTIPFR
jgi:hypothetical protein